MKKLLTSNLAATQLFRGAKVTETNKESIFSLLKKTQTLMPGDTLVITSAADSLPLQDSLERVQPASIQHGTESNSGSGVLAFLAIFGCVVGGPFLINWLWQKHLRNQAHKLAKSNFAQYDEWLSTYNSYYKSLAPDMRLRFMDRVTWFTTTKEFKCLDIPLDPKMPLLISAASVQITFGLDKYLLDFFDTIYIMQHNYNYGLFAMPFEGHVNSNGIYLSWDNFLRGYEDYTDADNVGIHEMAHALAYVNFMAGDNKGQDDAFIKRFYNFSAVARPIFNDMQTGKTNFLNQYAATNYNEFWAVAIETFFEQSLRMKIALPGLYESICSLLNQDPLREDKLLTVV
ncbi:MAG: zinc-dependent peptidase [Bacteroidota bacterium]